MNREQFQGQWNQVKGKAKEKWGKLTDNDITEINGKREVLLGKLQSQYGYEKERAERELDAFEKNCGCDDSSCSSNEDKRARRS